MMLPFGLVLHDTTPTWLVLPTDEDNPERLKADDDGPGCGCEQFSSCCFTNTVESQLFGGDTPRGMSGSANFLIWCITPKEREKEALMILSPHTHSELVTTAHYEQHKILLDSMSSMPGGSLSPQHGASSGCGWRVAVNTLNDIGVWIILMWILERLYGEAVLTGCVWFRIGTSGELL
jgi:hypothetical protein